MRSSFRPLSLLVALLFANGAYAATLTVVTDAWTYFPGQTITLTVVGTINPTVESTTNIDVRLEFTNASFVSSTADQALNVPPMFGAQTGWTVGGTEGTLSGNSVTVFNQIQGLPPGAPFVNNYDGVDTAYITATVLLTMGAALPVQIDFGPSTNFFGVGPGPGVTIEFIPEPTTATLLAMGLLGLMATRKR